MSNLQVRWFSLHFSKICTHNGYLSMECSKVGLVCINLLGLYTVKFPYNTPCYNMDFGYNMVMLLLPNILIMEFYKGILGK